WIEGAQRFVLVLLLMIPFEIRDLEYDDPELKTLPQRYGYVNTKIMGGFGALLFFFLTFLKPEVSYLDFIGKGAMFLAIFLVIYLTKKKQSRYFSSFWVEALPIFWWGFIWVLDTNFPVGTM